MISSKVFPLVSMTMKYENGIEIPQQTAKNKNATSSPILVTIVSKYLETINPASKKNEVDIKDATDFILGGNISPITAKGREPYPIGYVIMYRIRKIIGRKDTEVRS